MTESMVKRVENALKEAFRLQKINPWRGTDVSTIIPSPDWDAISRAAIAAMREPTEDMLHEGWNVGSEELDLDDRWRAMIDAALEESK